MAIRQHYRCGPRDPGKGQPFPKDPLEEITPINTHIEHKIQEAQQWLDQQFRRAGRRNTERHESNNSRTKTAQGLPNAQMKNPLPQNCLDTKLLRLDGGDTGL